jgi:crossover junction endodeoxyribonuclease RusA
MNTNFKVKLPVPPTANNLFPTSKSGHRFPSKKYTEWKLHAAAVFASQHKTPYTLSGNIVATYKFSFSDARRRDIANFEKAVTDFLVQKGVIEDDCLIDELHLIRIKGKEFSEVEVELEVLR